MRLRTLDRPVAGVEVAVDLGGWLWCHDGERWLRAEVPPALFPVQAAELGRAVAELRAELAWDDSLPFDTTSAVAV